MTRLPSTLILHKKIDGADTCFAQMDGELSNAPLQPWLGVLKHGAYNKAAADANWAFEPLESIWSETLDEETSESDGESTAEDDEAIFDDMDFPIDQQDSDSDKETESKGGEAEVETPKLKPLNINDSTSKALQQLYRKVQDSQDKLFFVTWQPEEARGPELRVAQVCWEECDPISTRQHGLYVVKWWCPRPRDQDTLQRALVDCQFWPELRKVRADGSIGDPFVCRPDKVKSILQDSSTKVWPSVVIPLAEIRVAGPFDFFKRRFTMQGPKNQVTSEPNHIAPVFWEQVEQRAPLFNLDVSRIRSTSST
jgi:hypothetical protein